MQLLECLPRTPLRLRGEVTNQFLEAGLTDFLSAAHYLQQLPFGRNADRSNFRLVLTEGRGTCSTKHALLAQLAREQGLDVKLTIGIYEMTERNTPGVGQVLKKYGLSCIPEAHCYIRYQGHRIDITRSGFEPSEPIERFLYEETITPEQIGNYKMALHQRFLLEWVANAGMTGHRSVEDMWRIREECIAALAQ